MDRRERLQATIRGETVDRPPVCFYELDSLTQDPTDPDPFNVFNDPSWKPLLDLTREKSDCIHTCGVRMRNMPAEPAEALTTRTSWLDENGSRFTRTEIKLHDRTLTGLQRRDPDVDTTWTLEHLLKNTDDLRAWLELPEPELGGEPDIDAFCAKEDEMGERGIVMIDVCDPLCAVAPLFEMGEFTVVAMTEPKLFHQALERAARSIMYRTERIARALPNRLWRIVGPEYASPPYLPPALFREYVTRYDTPMVEIIQRYGGYARIHSHGRLKDILDDIADTNCVGLDPIEPPHQGDVSLQYVRERYGEQMVLFGNIEISDIENLPTDQFACKVETALREGTAGNGRGFVLMPTACPYGRKLSDLTLRNYEKMVELTHSMTT